MSSLAATQADGYYLPAEYYDSGQYKKKSKNQFAGSKGHNQYLQNGIVRFELPYKGVCQGCRISISKGTRYNAKKVKTEESYFTTPIWEFQMKCRQCPQSFVIRTNPQERGFDFVSGVTIQKGQEVVNNDSIVDNMRVGGSTDTTRTGSGNYKSPLQRLESAAHGLRNSLTERDQIEHLQRQSLHTTLHDADANASIRTRFRKDRKASKRRLAEGAQLGWGKAMPVLDVTLEDKVTAKETVFGAPKQNEKVKWRKVQKSSIFGKSVLSTKKSKRRRVRNASPQETRSSSIPPPVVSSMDSPATSINEGNTDSLEAQPEITTSRKTNVRTIQVTNTPSSKQGLVSVTTAVNKKVLEATKTNTDDNGSTPPAPSYMDMFASYTSGDDSV